MTGELVRDRNSDTHAEGSWPCDSGGSHWSFAATGRGRPRRAATTRSWERGMEESLPQGPQEGTSPADTLASEFWPPELGNNKYPLLEATKFVVICFTANVGNEHSPISQMRRLKLREVKSSAQGT